MGLKRDMPVQVPCPDFEAIKTPVKERVGRSLVGTGFLFLAERRGNRRQGTWVTVTIVPSA